MPREVSTPSITSPNDQRTSITPSIIIAAEENHASRQAAEKVAAHVEGLLRNRIIIHGLSVSVALYSLIPGDELIN
ncbi:GNAT family N-acetyltransferase [Dickeya ananatis]|uniref:GNAT family N-acetyltransferase n=1 Tax=Dickeya ananatis TaxID=3061286 RepID=UPI00388E28CC